MTPEELDAARVKEAIRQCDSPTSVANMAKTAARLAREGWTPPKPVNPDLLAARKWLKGEGCHPDNVDAGLADRVGCIRAYLAGCTRGREGAKGLVEALEDMCALVKQNTYPQPDKPDTPWGRLQRALAALASAKRGG